tara:strand:- start:369 stop:704 length:336 start_codon:yes stop_codon:yes gene_type:complete
MITTFSKCSRCHNLLSVGISIFPDGDRIAEFLSMIPIKILNQAPDFLFHQEIAFISVFCLESLFEPLTMLTHSMTKPQSQILQCFEKLVVTNLAAREFTKYLQMLAQFQLS